MAVYVENVKKFINDHRSQFTDERRRQILESATNAADKNGLIMSGKIKEMLGADLSDLFFLEVVADLDHLQIAQEKITGQR
jgi:acetyl/propionyl-CoA carboxylase alpha subunit